AFLSQLGNPQHQQLVTEVITDPKPIADAERILKGDPLHTDKRGILERLRDEFLDAELTALKHKASQPDLTDDQRLEFLKQQQDLRAAKRKLIGRPDVF